MYWFSLEIWTEKCTDFLLKFEGKIMIDFFRILFQMF